MAKDDKLIWFGTVDNKHVNQINVPIPHFNKKHNLNKYFKTSILNLIDMIKIEFNN